MKANYSYNLDLQKKRPVVMQHYSVEQINNGGPATGALLLMNSKLKYIFEFVPLEQTFGPHGFNLKLILYFYRKIKQASPDVLHIRGLQSEGFYGVLAGKLAGCKSIIVSVHGVYSDSIALKGFKRWLFRNIVEPSTLRLADLVYCVCDNMAKRPFIKNNAKNLYGYIHNAAPDFSAYDKDAIKNKIRGEFGIKNNEIIAITVGRITLDKGMSFLLDSIKIIDKSLPDIKFIIVGEGSFLSEMENIKGKGNLDNVFFTGKRSDVHELLLASDFFILPSLHENLSNALLEASAASLPLIATNVGGNPEIVQNGYNGILIEPRNTTEIVNAIKRLYHSENERRIMGTNALKIVKEGFSQDYIFNKIGDLYKTMA